MYILYMLNADMQNVVQTTLTLDAVHDCVMAINLYDLNISAYSHSNAISLNKEICAYTRAT